MAKRDSNPCFLDTGRGTLNESTKDLIYAILSAISDLRSNIDQKERSKQKVSF